MAPKPTYRKRFKFRKLLDSEGKIAKWTEELKNACGVYVIQTNSRRVVYVGESHSNALKKTMIRHFQRWSGPGAGPTFSPHNTRITVYLTTAEGAKPLEARLIKRHSPDLNLEGLPLSDPPF